jgi:hypothetical protein
MGSIAEIITQMIRNPQDVRFREICKVCDYYFAHLDREEPAIGFIELLGRGTRA